MAINSLKCFQCGKTDNSCTELFGYIICDSCKSKLGLFTDKTIKKHIMHYQQSKDRSYEEEIHFRLDYLDKDYIKKRIKLLYIQERLNYIK